jgi:probable rRNA maturation factor
MSITLEIQRASRSRNLPSERQFREWLSASLKRQAIVTIRIVDREEGLQLNHDFRGGDHATNVLTFVYESVARRPLVGDIVLCAPVVTLEARSQRKPLVNHYAHLTVHAALHLQGFDHEVSQEAEIMERRETRILKKLGIPDPYADDER